MKFNRALVKSIRFRMPPGMLVVIILLLCSFDHYEANCDCDHWITPSDVSDRKLKIITFDAAPAAHDVKPGETICFKPVTYLYTIRLRNIKGTSDRKITIKNCGGCTVIDNKNNNSPDRGYHALDINGSEYFILRGDGDDEYEFGIKVAASQAHGVSVGGFSTQFEVQNLEIANTDGCGVNSKTDPGCKNKDLRFFTQRNSFFHHNYLHDIGTEGFYVGYTHYPENPYVKCDSLPAVLYGHPMENIRIYNNRLERIGWDGIQVGGLATGNKIYDNTIVQYATKRNGVHIHGIQLSGNGDQCDVFNNKILPGDSGVAGYGSAVAVWAKRTKIYNNLFVRTGVHHHYAVQVYDEPMDDSPRQFYVFNNTIIDPPFGGVSMFNADSAGKIMNNIIIQKNGNYHEKLGKRVVYRNNYDTTTIEGTGLDERYYITTKTPSIIRNAGANLYRYGITLDEQNQPRSFVGPFDIGFDEYTILKFPTEVDSVRH